MGCEAMLPHNPAIGRFSRPNLLQQHCYYVLKRSVNDFWPCIMENPRAVQPHDAIITLLSAILGKTGYDNIATMS
jgi:hypothetical protein